MKKKSIIIFLLLILFTTPQIVNVNAMTINDYKRQLEDLKKEKAENEKNKEKIKKQVEEAKQEINRIGEEIVLKGQEQEAISQQITKNQLDVQEKKEQIKDLIVFTQKSNSDNFYLKYLFGAENFTDFIYRVSIVQQLTKKNDELMVQMNGLIEEGKTKNKQLDQTKKELKAKEKQVQSTIASLGTKLSSYMDESYTIDDEIKLIEGNISFYRSLGCKDDQSLSTCTNTVPVDINFVLPLKSGVITDYYGYRSSPCYGCSTFHKGIDLGGNRLGTPVYAVAAGYVSDVTTRLSCGGNVITLNHIVNGKYYTTRYWHLYKYNVKKGDVVAKGQKIGEVGGDPSVTTYDHCSTGAHLHFEVANGHYLGLAGSQSYQYYSTYLNSIFNPQDLINIPYRW